MDRRLGAEDMESSLSRVGGFKVWGLGFGVVGLSGLGSRCGDALDFEDGVEFLVIWLKFH